MEKGKTNNPNGRPPGTLNKVTAHYRGGTWFYFPTFPKMAKRLICGTQNSMN